MGGTAPDAEIELPRDPSAYRPSNHFAQQYKSRINPEPTPDVVRRCIEDGTQKRRAPGIYHLDATVDGVAWRVVVDVSERPYEAVTVYAVHEEHDLRRAE